MSIYNNIIEKITEIENEKNVKIIYAVESGSRGWGFASEDSDYDCRFIYVNKYDYYLSINEKRDVIEVPVDEVYDLSGWDFKKTLNLMKKSNCSVFEWISSPIVYVEDKEIMESFREMANLCFRIKPSMYHYLQSAKSFYYDICDNETSKLKSYFYIIRPAFACRYIMENKKIPPMEFEKIRQSITLPQNINEEVNKLLEIKKVSSEKDTIPKNKVILDFIETEFSVFKKFLSEYVETERVETEELNIFFREVLGCVNGGL